MTLAERIYRKLMWLYPTKHRQAYERHMLQHARDLSRAARQRGPWHVAGLCLRLLQDGIVNAGIEQMEAIMMANNRFEPAPWLSVILASLPGLLVALSRRHAALLDPLLPILGYLYLGLLALAPPIIWWQRRRFPVWALLPAGALVWWLTYLAGVELSQQIHSLDPLGRKWIGIETGRELLHIVLAAVIFSALLRGRRVPGSFWLVSGVIVFGNLLVAALFSLERYGGARLYAGIAQFFTSSGVGPIEGLMLVAAGLLAARQHGVLALMVVVGGYSYMCADSDYLFGSPFREWPGLPAYLVAITFLYLVVTPVALLRARTRLGRALAVFVPVVAFHAARLIIPLLVVPQPLEAPWGDIILSLNVVLSLILAWVLYSHIGDAPRAAQPHDSWAA